jgi:hypothetical protein
MNRTLTLLQGLPTPYPDLTDIHDAAAWLERAGGNTSYLTEPRDGYLDSNGVRHSAENCKRCVQPVTVSSWDLTTVDERTLCSCVVGYNLVAAPGQKRRIRRVGVPSDQTYAFAQLTALAAQHRDAGTVGISTLFDNCYYDMSNLFPQFTAGVHADLDDAADTTARDVLIRTWPVPCSLNEGSRKMKALWDIDDQTRQQLADGELTAAEHAASLGELDRGGGGLDDQTVGLHRVLTEFPLPPLVDFADYENIGDWVHAETAARIAQTLEHDLTTWVNQVNDFIQKYRNTHMLLTSESTRRVHISKYTLTEQRLISYLAGRSGHAVTVLPTVFAWPLVNSLDRTQPAGDLSAAGTHHLLVGAKPSAFALNAIGDLVSNGAALTDAYACITALDV